ncbi:lipase family protein, partial [Xanthomonas hortorum]
MSIPSPQYARLSEDAYKDRAVGRRAPGQEEIVDIEGQRYAVLDHVNNKSTGYQGTIYRNEGSGEIVVAHRGTEGAAKDILTDATMVTSRTNPQAADALALTQNAMTIAKDVGKRTGHAPEVTVTGHSLGGALAQVSAHHYDLKGETFNSYGAASLSYRIPEGGNSVINHVMASDPVSAASPHFGQVRIYAKPDEITTLSGAGYSNSKANFLIPDYPLAAAGSSLGAHKLGNFLGEHSALTDPNARPLAEKNARMIDEYRNDVDGLRTGTTILTRSARGLGQDAVDAIRGPLAPGEPAKRDAREHGNDHTSLRI